jgi:3',5'-cyclic AMP phosphodiesterase CpdA/thymidylate synthase
VLFQAEAVAATSIGSNLMSMLLHLSDLHLGNSPAEDAVGDYKIESVPEKDRITRVGLMRNTLRALRVWLSEKGMTLDGIIITGDVTTRGRPSGFQELPSLLSSLEEHCPAADRILVVPGNHDVTWGTLPGSRKRYRAFIEGVRALGYVTPLLEGIDYQDGEPAGSAAPLLEGPDFVVAAINSADMCGVTEPLSDAAAAELSRLAHSGVISAELQAEIQRVRTYDMARISERQMAVLADFLDHPHGGRVRIAALHHQLMPVRDEEEVKPFEAIVNLGAFSSFLGDAGIDLVVHGHKHAAKVQTMALTGAAGEQRFGVLSSCGTIGGPLGTGSEIAKLIRIHSDLPTLRRVEILTVPAVSGGTRLRSGINSIYDKPTWRPDGDTPITVVSGSTVTDVHERLLELSAQRDRTPMRDVICVIDHGNTAVDPPATYPWPAQNAAEELPIWFKDIVGWWQNPERAAGKSFTHGQRLRDWSGDQTSNQLDSIAKILEKDAGSSRGIAVLVNPKVDDITDKRAAFPSFAILHLWIDQHRLHCSAFFRKQEMCYWWPVNVAELSNIQAETLQRLAPGDDELVAGAIRTYASEAVFSQRLPKVDVPRIDRLFWDNAASLRLLAVAVADADMDGRAADIATLMSLMEDWAPNGAMPPVDGQPVPSHGLRALAEMLTALADRYPESPASRMSDLLNEMDDANKAYLRERNTGDPTDTYRRWRTRQQRRFDELRELLR